MLAAKERALVKIHGLDSDAAGVFLKSAVAHIARAVLDDPMRPYCMRSVLRRGNEVVDIMRRLVDFLSKAGCRASFLGLSMDADDGRDMLIPVSSSERLVRQEDFDGTDVVAQAPVLAGRAEHVVWLGIFAERRAALTEIRLVHEFDAGDGGREMR